MVVVEDLISTGGSVLEVVNVLREAGAQVAGHCQHLHLRYGQGLERPAEASETCKPDEILTSLPRWRRRNIISVHRMLPGSFPSGTTPRTRAGLEVQNEKKCHQHSGSVCGGAGRAHCHGQ
ncbi:MAG: hypothetical protein ACLSHU_08215 [Oscillospiraceae bacterium]